MKLHRVSLEIIGLWPKTEQGRREKLICNLQSLIIFLIITIGVIIPSIHSLVKIHSDILLIVDNLIYTLPIITIMLKLVVFWWKKEGEQTIVNYIYLDISYTYVHTYIYVHIRIHILSASFHADTYLTVIFFQSD